MLLDRRAILPLSIGAVLACNAAMAQSWATYSNPRYGFSIDYPVRFRAEPPPANGDGRHFVAPDGAQFTVAGELNNPGGRQRTVAQFEAYLRTVSIPSDYAHVTYRFARANTLVLSGFRGGSVFYEKYVFSQGGRIINAFVMTYAPRAKAVYDPIVARMSNSFRPGQAR